MNIILKVVLVFVLILLLSSILLIAKVFYYTQKVNVNIVPFQKHNPTAKMKVLFAGDSTAVGTGATSNIYSTSGWFSHDFPEAEIENYSKNGMKLEGLIKILSGLKDKHYDLAVLQIGGNDIIYLTDLKKIAQEQEQLLHIAKGLAKKIIILHSGDIGKAPLFHWPFSWLYHYRSMKVRDIYLNSQDERVFYVDIYSLWDQLKGDTSFYYAKDNLHLSDRGYRLWCDFIETKFPRNEASLKENLD